MGEELEPIQATDQKSAPGTVATAQNNVSSNLLSETRLDSRQQFRQPPTLCDTHEIREQRDQDVHVDKEREEWTPVASTKIAKRGVRVGSNMVQGVIQQTNATNTVHLEALNHHEVGKTRGDNNDQNRDGNPLIPLSQ
ncbi:unnamed protein product [Amaranthus hypochondriacus]